MIMAAAQVSPMEPPMLPLSRDAASGMTSVADSLSRESSVAPVAPSASPNPGSGSGHAVVAAGKEINRNTRPVSAGLKMLQPRPPNAILAMAMANTAPAAVIHHGSDAGRLRASRTPVRSAEQSPSVDGRFSINRVIAHSVSIAAAEDMTSVSSAGSPK